MSSANRESEEKDCRICYESGGQSSMLSPCNCTGTMKYVHKQCLLSWINSKHAIKCELCKIEYRCPLSVRRPQLWTFIRREIQDFWADILLMIHIFLVMICSQILGLYVTHSALKRKCLSPLLSARLLDVFCKLLMTAVMTASTALNTFCLCLICREFREKVVDHWNQYFEYSFTE